MANEKRLIDANALVPYLWALFKFFGSIPCSEADKATQRGIKRCIGEIEKMPTVDAVEVVRCKDCIHWNSKIGSAMSLRRTDSLLEDASLFLTRDDDFCSYGERRIDDDGDA